MCVSGVMYNCGGSAQPPPVHYPPRPQEPPEQSQQPPPPSELPRVEVETRYFLSFPPLVGVNVEVFKAYYDPLHSELTYPSKVLPSFTPIALRYRMSLNTYLPQAIFTTVINPLIHTELRPHILSGKTYVETDMRVPLPSECLIVVQLLFHNQKWIVVIHEVYFPPVPLPEDGATPNDYRLALNNRTERLVVFYDSALYGLGSVSYSFLVIHLTPEEAIIENIYAIKPTSSIAYCMYIHLN
jgi:hypothetical protein